MLRHLYHLLLGAIAGLLVGIIPSLIAAFIFSNAIYPAGVLIGLTLSGAAIGIMLGDKIKWFYDGLFELITIG